MVMMVPVELVVLVVVTVAGCLTVAYGTQIHAVHAAASSRKAETLGTAVIDLEKKIHD